MTSTRDLVRIALFAALIAVLGLIPKFDLPFTAGVPITAQTMGVMLAGLFLGARNGFWPSRFFFLLLRLAPRCFLAAAEASAFFSAQRSVF